MTAEDRRPGGRGSTESFEDFFARTSRRVVGLVAVVTGDVARAEDATQEAYARAFVAWNRVSSLEQPWLWVTRVATRLAIDSWRRRRHEAPLDPRIASAILEDVHRLWIRWGLEQLTPTERLVVILKHGEGLPVKDIADRLGRSPETVKSHLAKAKRRLRGILQENADP